MTNKSTRSLDRTETPEQFEIEQKHLKNLGRDPTCKLSLPVRCLVLCRIQLMKQREKKQCVFECGFVFVLICNISRDLSKH